MHRRTSALALAALCTALTVISARLSFPLPGTGLVFSAQVVAVLMSGLLLGARWGAISQALYLLLGLLGLPVFAQGGGLGYMLHPTFGYLLGFPAAAAACGWAARRLTQPSWLRLSAAGVLGIVALYVVALPYTRLVAGALGTAALPLGKFLFAYCLAFLPLDAAKVLLAALTAALLHRRLPPGSLPV